MHIVRLPQASLLNIPVLLDMLKEVTGVAGVIDVVIPLPVLHVDIWIMIPALQPRSPIVAIQTKSCWQQFLARVVVVGYLVVGVVLGPQIWGIVDRISGDVLELNKCTTLPTVLKDIRTGWWPIE